MESSSPKPCRCMKRIRSSVSSVPFVVMENLNGLPSSSCTHSTSGFITVSNSSIGSPPKKFISGVPPPEATALAMRNLAASFAVESAIRCGSFCTKQ